MALVLGTGFERPIQPKAFTWVEEPANARPDLHFFSETENSCPQHVPRHLMRSYMSWRKHPAPSRVPAVGNGSCRTKEKVNESANGQAPIQTHKNKENLTRVEPSRVLEIGTLEPFNSLPIPGHANVLSLLNHMDRVVTRTRGLPSHRKGWISLAISDPVTFRVCMLVSALDLAGLYGKSVTPDILYWEGEAMRMISNQLRKSDGKVSDGMIIAVASLAHVENFTGKVDCAEIHAKGLDAMVKSRGGLQRLGELARRLVFWNDICCSITMDTTPRYSSVWIGRSPNYKNLSPLNSLLLLYQTKLEDLTGAQDLSHETIDILWEIRNLSRLKDEDSVNPNSEENIGNIPYSDAVDCLDLRLLPLIQLKPVSGQRESQFIFKLFGYAAHAHIYLFLRESSKDLSFCHLLSKRLQTILQAINRERLEIHYPEMMIWVYIMGGLSGDPASEKSWFAKCLVDMCVQKSIYGVDQLSYLLEEFLWSELYRSPVTGRFWEKVSKYQNVEGGYEVRRLPDFISLIHFNVPPDYGE
jgi:hypothetical protein